MIPSGPCVPPQPSSRASFEADACFVLRNISKTYVGDENAEIQALKALTVTIPWNARVGILGLSGAGKSTLLSILGLLDRADKDGANAADADILYVEGGQAWSYLGRSGSGIVPLSHEQTDQFRRRHFGFVFQSGHLLGYLTCDENVALGRTLRGESKPERQQEARALLESVGLQRYVRSRPRSLSGGQAQRVAALRALCHSPRVILADEPTGHLDAHNARLVLDRVLDWQRSSPGQEPRTLLLVTHDLRLARRYCDHFLILNEGRLVRGRLIRADEVSGEGALQELLSETATEDNHGASDCPDDQAMTVSAPSACAPGGEDPSAVRAADDSRSIAPFDLARFAWKDIVRRDDLLSTASGWLSLVLLTILSLVGWGFMRAKSELMERELENPRARALNIDCLDATTETGIDDRQVAVMEQLRLADGRMAVDPRSGGVKRWNIVRRLFWKGNSDPPAQVDRTLEGRSVDPSDPLLCTEPHKRILCFRPERRFHGFSSDVARELVVTSSLLAECGYPADAREILMDYQNQPVPIAIVGIVDAIPGGYQFLLTNRFLQQIQSGHLAANPNVDHVEIVPFPAQKLQRAIALLRPGLSEKNVELSSSRDGLELGVARGGLLAYSTLRSLAEKLARKIEKAGLAPDGALHVPLPVPQEEPPRDPLYMGCTLYLADVYDHEEVYERLTNDPRLRGLKADARFMDLIGRMRRTLRPLGLMLGGVVMCAVVVALINLIVMMLQRVQRRRNEIGVLKACGMTNRQLVVLYAIEGIVLGGTAAAISLPLATSVGQVFASYTAQDSAALGESTLFHVTPAMKLIVVAVVLLMCTLACLVATRQVVHVEPAQTLR